jgi:dynein heavy chain
MLALSGDPIVISNNYIQQAFEGIKKLDFSEEKVEITRKKTIDITNTEEERIEKHVLENEFSVIRTFNSMISEQGEEVKLINAIEPFELFSLDGEKVYKTKLLETWLTELEKEMKNSLSKLMLECYKDLKQGEIEREEWCCKWQEQAILTISQLDWTQKVSEALAEINKIYTQSNHKMNSSYEGNSLQILYSKEKENLLKLIKKMKQGKISKNLRKTLVSLIIQDVHANDVIGYIIQNSVNEINCFEWISQLRYYYFQSKNMSEGTIQVKMLNTERLYDYEYLGNQKRLVITQLTDRCYRTMMEALYNNLGGAPEGPAGTGKTETIKDLSKNLGKKCFTYNCSEESDYFLMTKFFKGVAMSGSWICFDEFNRITVDVLSVIAYQISTLLYGLKTRSNSVLFEKETINFNTGMAIFITMNPDYAGRSDLPDNLKGLFRPLAMMIPDYAMIAEIMLYSYGFNNARSLSRKVTNM